MELIKESRTIRQPISCSTEANVSVSSAIKETIGQRSITQFCEDSGLSMGYVSRLLNGKLKSVPSVRTLAKISCAGKDRDTKGTFTTLLKVCGHDLAPDEIQREIRIAEQTSKMIEKERENERQGVFSEVKLSASALGMVFSNLLMMGVPLQPKGRFGLDDGIEFGVKGYQFERVIVISKFCENSHQVVSAERDILRRLLKCVSNQKDVPMYLLIMNHPDVFDYMSEVVEDSVKAFVYILLANVDCTSLIKQKYVAAEGEKQKAPFVFVNEVV